MREEQLLARAQEIGRFMSSRLKGLQVRFPCVGEVRALGAMVAVELVKNWPRRLARCGAHPGAGTGRRPTRPDRAVVRCVRNVIRFLAPLTIPDALLKEGFRLFELALEEVVGTG